MTREGSTPSSSAEIKFSQKDKTANLVSVSSNLTIRFQKTKITL